MTALQEGAGLCRPEAMVSIRPVRAVVELGAVADVMRAALNAVHHANRHGEPDDRLAVALPGLHGRRGRMCPGLEVVVFGSPAALGRLLDLEGIHRLTRRGMVETVETVEVEPMAGDPGTAFLRDRTAARPGPSAAKRLARRAAERGETRPEWIAGQPDPTALALHYGSTVVHVRVVETVVADTPLIVGTYGFSARARPAVLPIRLDRKDGTARHAA